MEKFHNPYHRQLSELKACLLDAISPENALSLCRALQRDCLTARGRDRDEAWDRFFRLLEILGLPAVSPDLTKADEVKVFRASPPPMVEKIMRKEPAQPVPVPVPVPPPPMSPNLKENAIPEVRQ